jgi:hypothetical protein
MNGSPATLGRLFGSEDPTVAEFAGHLVSLKSGELAPEISATSGKALDAFKGLIRLIWDFLRLRESGDKLLLELTPEADLVLMNFSRQQATCNRSAPSSEKRFTKNAPFVAVKIAGTFQWLSLQRTRPISKSVVEIGIKMAEDWCQDTAKLAGILARQRDESELARIADKTFEFLAEFGRTKRWPLWKRFDHHPKDLMEPALELLIRTGRARSFPDGSVEAIERF